MRNTSRLAQFAKGTFGVFSTEQAAQAGVPRVAISREVARGSLKRVLPGVYAGVSAEGLETGLAAACLWAGKDAVVSHRAAAGLLGLDGVDPMRIKPEITIPRSQSLSARPVVVHRADIDRDDQCEFKGWATTTVERTLVDLASCVGEEALDMAVDCAWRRHLTDPGEIRSRADALGQQRRGLRQLRRVLDNCWDRGKPLESALEVRVWRLFKKARLPMPEVGVRFIDDDGHPLTIDFAYREQRVAIEADSFKHHGGQQAFEFERARLSRLAAAGWKVVHVTWAQASQPKRVCSWVEGALSSSLA